MDDVIEDIKPAEVMPDMWPLAVGETLVNHEWFPFYGQAFVASKFVSSATMENHRADIGTLIILVVEAMRQNPAGTLPDDDVELATFAKFKTVEEWQAVRSVVLSGWVPYLVEDERSARPIRRLGHPDLTEEIVKGMYKRKRGRDSAREAGRLSTRKNRLRAKMKEIGVQDHIIADTRALHALAEHFEYSDLYITPDNVRAALVDVLGYGGDVTPIHHGRRK